MQKNCAQCGASLLDRAKFCHRCGAPLGVATPSTLLPWAVAGIALLSVVAFVVGSSWRRGSTAASPVAAAPFATGAAPAGRAPDISSLSPQERADRLFDRVMSYVSEGKSDSVLFFAPMAIQSFDALAPHDAHRRYDLGLLGVVSGEGAMARAQADSILAEQPAHLLGLILGMRAAGLQLDTTARRGYSERFLAALERERAKRLPEYVEHQDDIDAAVREADGRAATNAQRTQTPPGR
jgi:hypothetical protein